MEFNKIIAVTGKPGLFEILSQTKTGVIVKSLIDQKRFPITQTQNVSLLDNIAIYTYSEEIPLKEIFSTIAQKENGKKTISHKESNKNLEAFFLEILPEYDTDRVYTSNIKKVIQWYNILADANFNFSSLQKQATTQEEE